MPFASEKQRRYLHMAEPEIAHAWEHGRSSVTGRKEGRKHHRHKRHGRKVKR